MTQTGRFTRAGISVGPSGAHAAVIDGDRPVAVSRPMPPEPTAVLTAIGAATTRFPDLVVVDISDVLLDGVVRAAPEVPQVAVVRIVPRPATDPALARSPADEVERLIRRRFTVPGGHDLLGHELCPIDDAAIAAVCAELVREDVRHVATVAAGSQARPEHERAVADAIQAALPGARISAAGDFGGQGLVAREATVVFDCALGALADHELGRWESALAGRRSSALLRVARGDGGYSMPSRIRTFPSVVLGATDALALSGAAHLAGLHDCRVLLPCAESGAAGGLNVRSSVQVAGDVRNGLPVVRPGELPGIGTELVVPTAALAPEPGPGQPRHRWPSADVPVAIPTRSLPELASVGAAIARPMAWLDEVAFIESAAQLDRIRRDAEERATGIVMANGAAPGTAHLTELSTVAVPYSPSGTVRIRVRVVGADDPSAQPAEPAGPALGSGAGCSAPEKRP